MLTVISPSPTEDLTTLETAKAELGITDAAQDETLSRLIRQASDAIAGYTGQVWGRATVRQSVRDVWHCRGIRLERALDPVVASVVEDGVTLPPDAWELDGATLYRSAMEFRMPWQAWKVDITYAAGFVLLEDLPHDVERACLLTVAAWHRGRDRDPMLRSEAAEGIGAQAFFAGASREPLPPQATALLQPYRSVFAS